MLKNTNQSAVRKLGLRSLQQNRVRNLFAILAIILTTMMFTSVFSIGFSLGKNLSVMMLRQQGTKTSIRLMQPQEKQIKQAKRAKHLNAAGIQIPVTVSTDADQKVKIRLDYYDPTEFEQNMGPAISDIHGTYPDAEDEIMLPVAALTGLKIQTPKQGMDIVLQIDSASRTFRLSGWYTDYSGAVGGMQGLVSLAYAESMGMTVEQDGILCLSALPGRQTVLLQELESLVSRQKGQDFLTTWDAQQENVDSMWMIAGAIGIMGLIIVASGYLLIYNIMYISVTRDIRFYGMLKTIGTSPSQIRKIVRMQITRLSLIGIPIGILIGTLLSFQAVPLALKMFSADAVIGVAMPTDISFNPFIYIGTILFAIITVMVSCRKPAKLAGKVSAVEALKYNGQKNIKVRATKSTDGGKLYKMAYRNVFREKKRAILVFASLFMGTMAFLTVNTFLGSMKLENYVKYYLPNDFTIYTASGEVEDSENLATEVSGEEERAEDPAVDAVSDNEGNTEKPVADTASDQEGEVEKPDEDYTVYAERLVKDIGELEGITKISVNHTADLALEFDEKVFRPFLKQDAQDASKMQELVDYYKENADNKDGAYSAPVESVDRDMIRKYNKQASQKMDIERFERGEICLIGDVGSKEEAKEVRGQTICLKNLDTGQKYSMEVGACLAVGEGNGLNIGYVWQMGGAPSCILISDAAMEKLCDRPAVDNIIIDCDPKAESRVKAGIRSLTKTNPCVLHTEIKSDLTSGFQSSMMAMNILSGGISIILILIGVLNFINVMITGVFARRNELAVMESVGMTGIQVRRMLVYEGAYYGGITLLLIATIGSALVYLITGMAQKVADYAVPYYPFTLMGALSVIILAICMCVPSVVYRAFSRESVTERLRNEG